MSSSMIPDKPRIFRILTTKTYPDKGMTQLSVSIEPFTVYVQNHEVRRIIRRFVEDALKELDSLEQVKSVLTTTEAIKNE